MSIPCLVSMSMSMLMCPCPCLCPCSFSATWTRTYLKICSSGYRIAQNWINSMVFQSRNIYKCGYPIKFAIGVWAYTLKHFSPTSDKNTHVGHCNMYLSMSFPTYAVDDRVLNDNKNRRCTVVTPLRNSLLSRDSSTWITYKSHKIYKILYSW